PTARAPARSCLCPPTPTLSIEFPALSLHDALPILAAPVVPVVAVLLLAVAPAGLGVAVTTTLLWLTGLPLASCSCTAGCCANAWPLRAVLEGGVVSTSRVAAPAVPVAVNVTGLPASPVAVAVAVFCPAVALKVHDVAAAIPSTPVATGV